MDKPATIININNKIKFLSKINNKNNNLLKNI